jgi:hypothetical protein
MIKMKKSQNDRFFGPIFGAVFVPFSARNLRHSEPRLRAPEHRLDRLLPKNCAISLTGSHGAKKGRP